MLRVNLNFTIVSMVNFVADNSSGNSSDDCGFIDNSDTNTNATLNEVKN
jgi:hypothetical protein